MAVLMIQGCGSDVGKSVLTAGLCRLFANRGLAVRPFKPQNMSNNAAVTPTGGEIGRAQALQAAACRTPATVDMNPVLLKPQSDTGAQVIVRGAVAGDWSARAFIGGRAALLDTVLESYARLHGEADLVIVEGAGSPAETNLRKGDIANMGFALAADAPVVLVGDIDRGHVIAALAGAHAVLDEADRQQVRGFIVNKFRGDPTLFDEGRRTIARLTGWPDLGLVPWLTAAARLPAEDAVALERPSARAPGRLRVVVPMLSRIANFDDFDPLKAEPQVDFAYVPPGRPLPADADLVILPGTKATVADARFLRTQGWDIDILSHVRRGGRVLGICGGYQLLGRSVSDPDGLEGSPGGEPGLGLLEVDTVITRDKIQRPAAGAWVADPLGRRLRLSGYEIHAGLTSGPGAAGPMLHLDGTGADGAVAAEGRVAGTYLHGLFAEGAFRAAFLEQVGASSSGLDQATVVDAALDDVADVLERSLDIDVLTRIAGLNSG